MVLVLPANHELSKKYHLPQDCHGTLPLLPIGLLKDTPFIQMHSEQKLHQQLLSLCEEAGFKPQIYLQSSPGAKRRICRMRRAPLLTCSSITAATKAIAYR